MASRTPGVIEIRSDEDTDEPAHSDGAGTTNREDLNNHDAGEQITWSDDEPADAAYQAFKKRKSTAQQRASAVKKRQTRASKQSMVGRKRISGRSSRSNAQGSKKGISGLDDPEAAFIEDALPDYLQQWRRSWTRGRDERGTDGLRLPPSFDDLYFSDDEHMADLQEKPQLLHIKPPRPYEDVEMRTSLGIIPAPIAQYLKPYQVEGVEWLHQRFVYQEGGILGDDMGLGKTIQVIAFLTAAFGKTGDERDAKRMRKMRRAGDDRWYPRVLIICPGGLMANWRNELARWGWWQIYTFHGSTAEKDAALAAAETGRLEIMITTYTTYRLNQDRVNGTRWDCVIADECHTIKERDADITKAMNDINALCRLGLSGTAIQNKYEELWTLLNWTSPGMLGSVGTWRDSVCVPLKMGQSHDATVAQLSKARRIATKLVKNLLPRFFLRRTKALIADQLPTKSDRVVFCPLSELQAQAYNNFVDHEIVHAIRDSADMCYCKSGKKLGWCCNTEVEGFGRWQTWVFPCLVTLQKLANHVALLVPSGEADPERHEKELQKLTMALPDVWEELYQQRDNIVSYANPRFCGKWAVLKKLLRLWYSNGDKVLVFSHSVRLLKMLKMLFKATTTYNVSYLDGAMNYEDRQQTVDEYNADPAQFVFLISTRAGGVGLNITSANKVVVVDPNWNPAYDLQAQDRAYRIGQARDVEVFRLVSVGTVEEIVYARQIYKQQQANIGYTASVERRYFRGVQDNRDQKGEIFGLGNLFAPQSANVVLRDIVNKTNIAETRAGVEIAGLDLEAAGDDDNDDGDAFDPSPENVRPDAAISQLAADIVGDTDPTRSPHFSSTPRKRKDPVQAILASAGVEYTHENSEVIGTSKIEGRISSRAQKNSTSVADASASAFAPASEDLASAFPYASPALVSGDIATDGSATATLGDVAYRFRPPPEVRKRQLASMARHFGYEDVVEFALVVEGWTQRQRRECLDRFYADRRAKRSGGGDGGSAVAAGTENRDCE